MVEANGLKEAAIGHFVQFVTKQGFLPIFQHPKNQWDHMAIIALVLEFHSLIVEDGCEQGGLEHVGETVHNDDFFHCVGGELIGGVRENSLGH